MGRATAGGRNDRLDRRDRVAEQRRGNRVTGAGPSSARTDGVDTERVRPVVIEAAGKCGDGLRFSHGHAAAVAALDHVGGGCLGFGRLPHQSNCPSGHSGDAQILWRAADWASAAFALPRLTTPNRIMPIAFNASFRFVTFGLLSNPPMWPLESIVRRSISIISSARFGLGSLACRCTRNDSVLSL
jgi:hypothetical protein